MFAVLSPLAYIGVPGAANIHPLTVSDAVGELAFVVGLVWVGDPTYPLSHAFAVEALKVAAVWTDFDSDTVLEARYPVPVVLATSRVTVCSYSMVFPGDPLPFILIPGGQPQEPLPILLVVSPLAVVVRSFWPALEPDSAPHSTGIDLTRILDRPNLNIALPK